MIDEKCGNYLDLDDSVSEFDAFTFSSDHFNDIFEIEEEIINEG